MAMECQKCKRRYDITTGIPENEICECGGELKIFERKAFSCPAIIGGEWNYLSKGYHPERDDPANEIRFDMKKLEQKMTETHNLKEYYDKKKALKYFEEAHKGVLK
jgi:hypothetical protein